MGVALDPGGGGSVNPGREYLGVLGFTGVVSLRWSCKLAGLIFFCDDSEPWPGTLRPPQMLLLPPSGQCEGQNSLSQADQASNVELWPRPRFANPQKPTAVHASHRRVASFALWTRTFGTRAGDH